MLNNWRDLSNVLLDAPNYLLDLSPNQNEYLIGIQRTSLIIM